MFIQVQDALLYSLLPVNILRKIIADSLSILGPAVAVGDISKILSSWCQHDLALGIMAICVIKQLMEYLSLSLSASVSQINNKKGRKWQKNGEFIMFYHYLPPNTLHHHHPFSLSEFSIYEMRIILIHLRDFSFLDCCYNVDWNLKLLEEGRRQQLPGWISV